MNLLSWQISPLFDPFFSDSVTEAAVVDAAERSDDNRSGATLRKDQVQYPARGHPKTYPRKGGKRRLGEGDWMSAQFD